MASFRGSFDHTLDSKNRLTIPARFRSSFGDGVVLSLMHDAPECVSIWSTPEFEAFLASVLQGYHPMSAEHADIQRFYTANSQDSELDGAGRVMVPARMLSKVGLDREVVVNGVANRLEVWPRESWNARNEELAAAVRRIRPAYGNTA
jgi:MraZ protein